MELCSLIPGNFNFSLFSSSLRNLRRDPAAVWIFSSGRLRRDKKIKAGLSTSFCTEGGNRTRTTFWGHRILSPACLPVPPLQQNITSKQKSLSTGEGFRVRLFFERKTRFELATLPKAFGMLYQLSYICNFKILLRKDFERKTRFELATLPKAFGMLYQLSYICNFKILLRKDFERKTRFELATPTLARSCSTN